MKSVKLKKQQLNVCEVSPGIPNWKEMKIKMYKSN